MPPSSRSFAALPPEAADVLRPVLPGLAEETIAAIAAEVPDYARAMEGGFGRAVRGGVVVAFNRFVDLVVEGEADLGRARETYVALGRGEFRAGRSLDALLAAYRVGARVAWRRFVEAGKDGGLSADVLYDLGEAIFAYIDELSAESAEGYAEEQSAAAGESQRRRRRLVRLLAQDPPASEESLRTAARSAAWTLPRSVAAVAAGGVAMQDLTPPIGGTRRRAAAGRSPARRRPTSRAPGWRAPSAAARSAARPPPASCACSSPTRTRRPAGASWRPRWPASRPRSGPTVPWAHAGASLRRAAGALRLRTSGRLPGSGADRRRGAPGDAAAGRRRRTWPRSSPRRGWRRCTGWPTTQRERLTATLHAWLDRPGQVQAVAATLGVHPQTVRYRLARLRELFGERLEDPDARFELALALRVA